MITLAPYRASWKESFAALGADLREALGRRAVAIHHIGSTSVPGLAAKDVIDVQVTVTNLDAPLVEPLEGIGLSLRDDLRHDHPPPHESLAPEQLEKRCFVRAEPRAHVHVRVLGRYNQRYALLCRDYLRATPAAAQAYGEVKRRLARRFADDREAYDETKDPVFDVIVAGAEVWARATGWREPPTDA